MARGKKAASALSPEEKLQQALVPTEEQPYPIPENWCWVKLGKLYKINPKVTADDTVLASFVPMERIEAGMTGRFTFEIRPWGKARKNHTQFADGDVAFAKISPCFENQKSMVIQGLTNGIGGGTTELIILRQPLMNQKYTFLLVSTEDFISRGSATYSGTVGQQRISMDFVKGYYVPVPPLAEQQRIVDRIESLFAKLDEAKEKAQVVVDGFELRKSAILHKAFSGELTERWRKEHRVELKGWQETNIDSISDVKGGKRVPKGMSLTTDDTGHPYLKAGNLKLGTVLDEGIMFVPDDVWQYIKNYTVNAGDVYITNVGACIGDCGIIPDKYDGANLTENAVKMTNLKCNSQFLAWYLSSNGVQQRIKNLIASATLGKLSITNIKTIPISLPTSEEQREIVFILDKLFRKEQQAQSAAKAVLSQIDTMKKAILARAFCGGLGTNDPAEEWAGALVKAVL